MRGDDDAALGIFFQSCQHRRHEIGKALAHARARLHHQVVAIGNRGCDFPGHLKLLRPRLVILQPLRDQTARAEDGIHVHPSIVAKMATGCK